MSVLWDHLTRDAIEFWTALGAHPPRYRYLTGAYVEALGLERIPLRVERRGGIVSHGLGGSLPDAGWQPFLEGVELDGWFYRREPPWGSCVAHEPTAPNKARCGRTATIPLTRRSR